MKRPVRRGSADILSDPLLVFAIGILLAGCPSPLDDHSDTPAGATTIDVHGHPVSGSIESANDEDFFRFSASAGTTYTIETGG